MHPAFMRRVSVQRSVRFGGVCALLRFRGQHSIRLFGTTLLMADEKKTNEKQPLVFRPMHQRVALKCESSYMCITELEPVLFEYECMCVCACVIPEIWRFNWGV